jgi:LysR family glycine cleavage system transcriptional activator
MNETKANQTRRRNLPSLSALRAFEAAARHGSFRAAAEELNVTHSAISHQVKALEEDLGVPVFSRGGRAIRLTEEGRLFFPILRDAFDGIVAGADVLRRQRGAGPLTLQVYVTLAVKWLLPRLHGFYLDHPEVQIFVGTSYTEWDFHRDDVDAAIVFADQRHADLDYTHLGRAKLFPVCSPALLDSGPPLREAADLRHHRLLDVYPARHDWRHWLDSVGLEDLRPDPNGARFDSYLLSLEEAAAGEGVSLATRAFVAEDLASGRLIAPLAEEVDNRAPWCFVCPRERRNEPRIAALRDWLLETIGADGPGAGFD